MEVLVALLSAIGTIILLINVVAYFTGFAGNSKAYKIFSVYLLSIFIIQALMEILARCNYSNLFLSGYYLFAQFIFLSCFFYYLFLPVNNKKSGFVKYFSAPLVIILLAQYFFDKGLYYTFNPPGFLVTSLVLVTYAVMYLAEMLTQKPFFNYATTGIFIYLISSSLIFASSTSIITLNNNMFAILWQINAVLFIIYQLLILWEWKQHFFRKTTK